MPGDIRDILNQVVTAEKEAQASLIRRREETAATRSLLNTAKLMEDNPLLVRLKELEALEKISGNCRQERVMKVFISWSGPQSKGIAQSLRDWLPKAMQTVQPGCQNMT